MHKRILPIAITAIILLTIFSWNCTKLDTTDIGSDLLPAVDNVHTFADTLLINTTQGIFNDTTIVNRISDQALGKIDNDPLFGSTTADVFMQLKPSFYPYYFGNSGDTLVALDSVVLCLKYKGFWGDSITPVHLNVKEVTDNNFRDDVYKEKNVTYSPGISGTLLGSADVDSRTMDRYIRFNNGRDSVNNQIRIKLDQGWANNLLFRDSASGNALNNAFYNDSIYRRFYNGIAVMAYGSSNQLIYVNLADTSTKLEVYFKSRKNNKMDTGYNSLKLNNQFSPPGSTAPPASSTANHIVRGRSGYPVSAPASTDLYLQTAPGTYVNLSISGLSSLSNRIVHRAEIFVEQVPTNAVDDAKFSAPNFLYLDLKDTGTTKWKPIYSDLNTGIPYDPDFKSGLPYYPSDQNGGISIDYIYFGGYKREKADLFGNVIKYYSFNITRYVQQIVTRHTPNYDFRLYAPFNLEYPQYASNYIPFGNNIALGRVRIGSGSNPNYRLRLRIIYSKL